MRFNKCILLVIYAIIAIVVFTPLYAENSNNTIFTLPSDDVIVCDNVY